MAFSLSLLVVALCSSFAFRDGQCQSVAPQSAEQSTQATVQVLLSASVGPQSSTPGPAAEPIRHQRSLLARARRNSAGQAHPFNWHWDQLPECSPAQANATPQPTASSPIPCRLPMHYFTVPPPPLHQSSG